MKQIETRIYCNIEEAIREFGFPSDFDNDIREIFFSYEF